ncbi:transcription antitermination factor NusB [Persicitalea jodogahamensis]|uniref:NusB/RsmB/TIM44 domain-containing protein n=1 Tax=Persicitalea jodogahamensis TaxID=402147 RepID=A0A8J3D591_9BACT|nr:transcription antitermination factor NusB [Persicitalea jodogahamensis]GHB77061.1 hypothetical protein GCM10007390_33850 [Persicitalea jodogahamensis]
MLNRRLLRSKAVQALYASRISADANLQLAKDEIAAYYVPDLNSMQPQNLEKLEGLKRLALLTLDEYVENGQPASDEQVPREVIQTAHRAYQNFVQQNKVDRPLVVKRVLQETEGIYDEFLRILALMLELAHQSELDRERIVRNPDNPFPTASGLNDNEVVRLMRADTELEVEIIRRGISWGNDMSIVRKTYREALCKDEDYINYCEQPAHTPEEDQKMAQHVLRNVILKHEIPVEHFEQNDLYWEEHFDIIRSMSIKTLRSANDGKIQLAQLTEDWDEDRFFVEELFKKAVENDAEYEGYILEQLKNWDLDRVALLDMIILKAALAELIHFPGIPVKVTINEFIEIAKRYSTLKSGSFVNGNLDRLAKRLAETGVIRKSGRGLIDNK